MTDLVDQYVVLERGILTHRLRVLLSGAVLCAGDPEEERVGDELEALWWAMTPDQRSRVDCACNQRRSAWVEPPSNPGVSRTPHAIWLRALPQSIEISLPLATRSRLAPSRARGARMLVAWEDVESIAGFARGVLIDAAVLLLGRSPETVREEDGLKFFDPDTVETLLVADAVPSGVAERPDPPQP